MLDAFFNFIFGWAVNIHPWFGMFVIALVVSLIITLSSKFLTDQVVMKQLREEVKKDSKKVRELHKTDPKKAAAMQKEILPKNLKMMKLQIKSMIVSMILVLLLFSWLPNATAIAEYPFWFLGWFWAYVVLTLILSLVVKKVMKVY